MMSIFRNSLALEMVEALVCSEDWLRSSSSSADLMEEGEPIPFLQKKYYESEYSSLFTNIFIYSSF